MLAYRSPNLGGAQGTWDAAPVQGRSPTWAGLGAQLLADRRTVPARRLTAGVWRDDVPDTAEVTLCSHSPSPSGAPSVQTPVDRRG